MATFTRREFLRTTSAAAVGGSMLVCAQRPHASPLDLPIGLQLYSVRELLPRNYAGTLKQISTLGYKEVEAAGYFNHTVSEVRDAMQAAGLRLVSAHYSYDDLNRDLDGIIEFNRKLGLRYLICSFPGIKNPSRLKDRSTRTIVQSFTMEDWRWNADRFNEIGKKIKTAGMQFGYHNHTMEFGQLDGVVPFEELLRLTDPALVTIELDCGWVAVGGGDVVSILNRFPTRISMLHVKDFKKTQKPASVLAPPPASVLGEGTADYHRIFVAAKKANIRHYFVEQEEFDRPPMVVLKIDEEYMKHLEM